MSAQHHKRGLNIASRHSSVKLLRLLFTVGVIGILIAPSPGLNISAKDVKLVSWNFQTHRDVKIESRKSNFRNLDSALQPDVLILVELADGPHLKLIAKWLGWKSYYAVASDWHRHHENMPNASLETAVISKLPIEGVIEFDAGPDDYTYSVFSNTKSQLPTVEEAQLETWGKGEFGTINRRDRGTMRVDLDNGLSIFPVHLKSNYIRGCGRLSEEEVIQEHKENAQKRERIMAAVAKLGAEAVGEGRIVVIAGDLNTAFEEGKAGTEIADCELTYSGCAREPFPPSQCVGGDGFDDTLGMLSEGLIDQHKWSVLTKGVTRTYDSGRFSDAAIDHFAIPVKWKKAFKGTEKAQQTFGSDHFPIMTIFNDES